MSFKNIIQYWKQSSEKDIEVAQSLFQNKHYSHTLFFCHLALEKLLKAVYVSRNNIHAPYIHDLVILAKRSGIVLTIKQKNAFEIITSFNIQGRYADYKSQFYKKFNKHEYAKKYLDLTKGLLIWLEKELTQK